MFDNLCVTNNYTILEVMQSFEDNTERAAIVRNSENQVIGVISQGDIIKAVVRGVNILEPIGVILKPSLYYLNEYDKKRGFEIIKDKGITLIPVLDDSFQLKQVIRLSELLDDLELRNE